MMNVVLNSSPVQSVPVFLACLAWKLADVHYMDLRTLERITLRSCSTVGSSQVDTGHGWRVSRHTSGRAPGAQLWTNQRRGIVARASGARGGTQRRSGACARLATVNRCLNVMRCPSSSRAAQRKTGCVAFARVWPKFVRPCVFCPVSCVSGVRGSDRRFACVRVWHVIETRDRGVFVLHGCFQERKRAAKQAHFLLFSASWGRQFVPQDTTLRDCRCVCEALASCWTANTPTKGWTTTPELCPFDSITWHLFFKAGGHHPHLCFVRRSRCGFEILKG